MHQKILAFSVRHALLVVAGAALGLGCTSVQAANAGATHAGPAATKPQDQQATDNTNSKKGEQATQLNAITVTGQLGSLLRAQATKRNAVGVVDSVSAEEAGKFPDQNVADALQRVPGVSVDRSGGVSNRITVRGFGPQFINVLVNGRKMATASGGRAFDFDVLPVAMLQQAVVHKTGEADISAGGIGATVNVVTTQPLNFNGFHISAKVAGVNDSTRDFLSGEVTPKASFLIGDTDSDGSFGWLLSGVYYKRDHHTRQVSDSGWLHVAVPLVDPNQKIYMPQTWQGQVTHTTRTRRGMLGAVEWRPNNKFTAKINAMYIDYKIDSTANAFALFSNPGIITSLETDSNQTALAFRQNASGGMSDDQIKMFTPSDIKNFQGGINLKYRITQTTQLAFDSSVSRAWNKEAEGAYFVVVGTRNTGFNPTWTNNGTDRFPSYTNFLSPGDALQNLYVHFDVRGNYVPHRTNEIFQNRLHLSHYFDDSVLSKIDVGIETLAENYKSIQLQTPNGFSCKAYCGYIASVPASTIDAHLVDYGSLAGGAAPGFPQQWIDYDADKLFAYMTTPAAYNQLPASKAAEFKKQLAANGGTFAAHPLPGSYSRIHELDRAAYVMGIFQGDWGTMPWKLNVGVRYTKTHTTAYAYSQPLLAIEHNPSDPTQGLPVYGPLSPIQEDGSYHYWLPSLNFRINLKNDLVLRAAASKTLSRPTLGNLSAAVSYNFRPTTQSINKGNPGLKPYLSKNYDLGLEWYFGKVSYLALDAFYKTVENFSTLVTTNVDVLGLPFTLTEPVNLNTATVKGAELTFNYKFTHLPAPFDGLGMATNYTYVTSSASLSGKKIVASGKFAIPGIGNSANASVYYQKGPVQLRLAYNWRQTYLASIAGLQGLPTSVKDYGQLDFSSSYDINKHLFVFLNATNLDNEKLYQYQVFHNRPILAQANGRTVTLGLRGAW